MEVKLAKSAGFCFGVKRAVDLVYEEIEKNEGPIYTYGPIIHNEEVVSELAAKGVHVIPEEADLSEYEPGTVIIRSHGVSRNVHESLENSGFSIVDATCPFVLKIHRYVDKYSAEGYFIVIVGNESHPEVQGIIGWIHGDRYAVISSEEDLKRQTFLSNEKICIVSQTTFNYNKFQELVEIVRKKGYDINVVKTICNATEERQSEAAEIAGRVNTMVVIGGTHSSNSRKLYEICKAKCENTFYIQTLKDLKSDLTVPVGPVGITAGASTPNNIIEEVQNYVRINF